MSPILFFIIFFICTGVGKIFLQINSAAVAFIDILIVRRLKLVNFDTVLCFTKANKVNKFWNELYYKDFVDAIKFCCP